MRIGARRTRLKLSECDAWLLETYGVRRHGPANGGPQPSEAKLARALSRSAAGDITKTSSMSQVCRGGTEAAGEFLDKRALAARWRLCPRSISNLLAMGLPHLKIGTRRVRFVVSECDKWLIDTFHVQRLGPGKPEAGQ